MIEQLLGTSFFCALITFFSYILFYKLACKVKINSIESDVQYIGDYAGSIIVFMAISSLTLLLIVAIYLSWDLPSFLSDSGIIFAFIQFAAGLFIRFLYWLFFSSINKLTKSKTYHKLTPTEISWTWLMICTVYGIVFLIQHEYTIGLTYFVIVISYFFWLDSSTHSIKEKLMSIKELSSSYWYVVIFIGISAFVTLRYKTNLEIIFAIIGMMIGIILCIIPMYYSFKKRQPSTSSDEQDTNTP